MRRSFDKKAPTRDSTLGIEIINSNGPFGILRNEILI